MAATIPVIDISPLVRLGGCCGDGPNERLDEVVSQIARACETFGFFAVTNHGVDASIITSAWEASRDFFDCDDAVKAAVSMSSSYPYGYESHESLGTERSLSAMEAIGEEGENAQVRQKQPSSLSPDSKETFSIGPVDSVASGMPPRQFPKDAPAAFAPALTEYFSVMEQLARVLFRGLALALKLDDASWFLQDGRFDDGHQCALRILNYPQLEYDGDNESEKVHIRAGAHTDYGAMTILKSGGPGLQLKLSDKANESMVGDSSAWIDVPHLSDAFVINLGDLMQRWTNDRWRSTLHRVVAVADNASPDEGSPSAFHSARRQSIAFFVNMNGDATVVPFDACVDNEHPARYGAIKASDHLIQRHRQSMGNGAK